MAVFMTNIKKRFKFEGFFNEKQQNIIGALIMFSIVAKFYFSMSHLDTIAKLFMLITIILALPLILNNISKYNITHYMFFAILCIGFVLGKNITLLYGYFLSLGLINIDFKFLMKIFFIANIIAFCLFLVANILQLKPSEFIDGRNDFGFGNPNTAFICMYLIWFSYLYLVFDDIKFKDILFLVMLTFVMYSQTETRTGLLTLICTAVLVVLIKKIDIRKKSIKILLSSVPVLATSVSLVIAYVFNQAKFFNSMLSHRPNYWYTYLAHPKFGLNLFGHNPGIKFTLFVPRVPIDSGYVWSLYSLGMLVYALLLIIYVILIYKLCADNKKAEIVLVISILIYSFAESILLDLANNVALILIVYALTLNKEKNKVKRISK